MYLSKLLQLNVGWVSDSVTITFIQLMRYVALTHPTDNLAFLLH
jgi:hypothetical protein